MGGTGASDDLSKADIGRSIAVRYGMSDALGQMTYERQPEQLVPGAPPMGRSRV